MIMDNYESLQKRLVASVEQNTFNNDVKQIKNEFPHVLQQAIDSLLYPEKYGPVIQVKVWLIDFYCHDGYLIIHKSKKHQKLLNRFFEEYHGETARR